MFHSNHVPPLIIRTAKRTTDATCCSRFRTDMLIHKGNLWHSGESNVHMLIAEQVWKMSKANVAHTSTVNKRRLKRTEKLDEEDPGIIHDDDNSYSYRAAILDYIAPAYTFLNGHSTRVQI